MPLHLRAGHSRGFGSVGVERYPFLGWVLMPFLHGPFRALRRG
jgi:hypothetical protein